jgi:PilZ domain
VTIDREHPRYAHEAAVTFYVGAVTHEGRTQNVSRGGLCASLADPVPVGTDVDVSIVLVFDDDMQSEALRLPARVVWCTDVDEAHQVGIAFRPLDAQRAEYLAIFLRYLDDHRAETRPRDLSVDDRFR